jgi:hypothetical protein
MAARVTSSTSSSRPRHPSIRREGLGVAIAQFAAALVSSAVLSIVVWVVSPLAARPFDIRTHDVPYGQPHYLAHNRSGHIDHHVLYHGLNRRADDHLRAADVLLLGNSRMMLALPRQALEGFFERRGLRFYSLGFGHDEPLGFAEAVLDARDLRPRAVIVNVDGFFGNTISAWGRRVLDESRFDAWKWWFESTLAHNARRRLHGLLPHWPDLYQEQREWIMYRSVWNGTWFLGTRFGASGELRIAVDSRPPSAEHVRTARSFVAGMQAGGTTVLFCLVPSPETSLRTAQLLADAAGVPLVAPTLDGLETMDGSHLTTVSAHRFARAFVEELGRTFPPMFSGPIGGAGTP